MPPSGLLCRRGTRRSAPRSVPSEDTTPTTACAAVRLAGNQIRARASTRRQRAAASGESGCEPAPRERLTQLPDRSPRPASRRARKTPATAWRDAQLLGIDLEGELAVSVPVQTG